MSAAVADTSGGLLLLPETFAIPVHEGSWWAPVHLCWRVKWAIGTLCLSTLKSRTGWKLYLREAALNQSLTGQWYKYPCSLTPDQENCGDLWSLSPEIPCGIEPKLPPTSPHCHYALSLMLHQRLPSSFPCPLPHCPVGFSLKDFQIHDVL